MRDLIFDDETLIHLTPWPALIDALREAFRIPCEMPQRSNLQIPHRSATAGAVLVMPSWVQDDVIGLKILNVFPSNASIGKPAIHGVYVLSSAADGEILALFDAKTLTARRTAATSALAARFLARPDSNRLLLMGTGHLAPFMAAAHCSVRPIRHISVWGRSFDKAAVLARHLSESLNIASEPVDNLESALSVADVVCTATLASQPVLFGAHVKPGTHVDLVGGFTPLMREADDTLLRRAIIYVDQRRAALLEAGDISDPIARGIISSDDIVADLGELCTGRIRANSVANDITLFKSVGLALEDLATARLAFRSFQLNPIAEISLPKRQST
jgi:alanine dehydrogenase